MDSLLYNKLHLVPKYCIYINFIFAVSFSDCVIDQFYDDIFNFRVIPYLKAHEIQAMQ